jgi:UPF0755 protein
VPSRRPARGDYQRHGGRRRQPERGSGRSFAWVALLLGVGVIGGFALLRDRFGGSSDPVVSTAEAPPVSFVIPEGLRREDIAAKLDAETMLSGEEYLRLTAASARGATLAGASKPTSLEGFLFPATYQIGSRLTVQELVDAQIDAYAARVAGVDYRAARSKNLTKFDVLTIAAMIEREVRRPDERRLVAGVMYNRLKQGIRLDIDATVQFAIGSWKTELTLTDLANDSPYNTRKFPGLPPGPICNPGLASIRAAANPKPSNFIYYVARGDGSGGHYFATTPAEFEVAVAKAAENRSGG